ncbi:MAG: CdaR family protein [Caldilineaceae bacterium]
MQIKPAHLYGTTAKRILDQLGTLLLAIILALIVWLIAITEEDPIIVREFPTPIPLTARGLAEGYVLLQELEPVIATVEASKTQWDELKTADFSADIDVNGLDVGVYDVDVQLTVDVEDVRIIALDNPQRHVQIDKVIAKDVPVRIDVADGPAFGYEAQTPVYNPVTVNVSGPSSLVEQVEAAGASIYLRNAKSQVDRLQVVTPLNAANQFVSGVTVMPSTVSVVVPVTRLPDRKEAAVRPTLVGQPDAGYRLSAVKVEPSSVVLSGDNALLDEVPGFIETEPFELAGATGEIRKIVSLVVPEGISVLGGNNVFVTITVSPIEGGATVQRRPTVENLGEGLEATIELESVDVILRGPAPQLEKLKEDDVKVVLDLGGLLAGVHSVRPRVALPNGISPEGVLPETVEVRISNQETSTPFGESPLATPVITTTVTPGVTQTPTARGNTILPPTPTPTP